MWQSQIFPQKKHNGGDGGETWRGRPTKIAGGRRPPAQLSTAPSTVPIRPVGGVATNVATMGKTNRVVGTIGRNFNFTLGARIDVGGERQ